MWGGRLKFGINPSTTQSHFRVQFSRLQDPGCSLSVIAPVIYLSDTTRASIETVRVDSLEVQ